MLVYANLQFPSPLWCEQGPEGAELRPLFGDSKWHVTELHLHPKDVSVVEEGS